MKKKYCYFILALIFSFHVVHAQFVKPDPHYTYIEDDSPSYIPDSKFIIAKTGHVYKRNNFGKVVRYLSNGNVDTSFGVGGSITPPQNMYYPVAVNDNALYLAYIDGTLGLKLITKYDLNGNLDTGFGINGVANLQSGPSGTFIEDVVINTDQSLYVKYKTSVIKVLPTGIIDTVFGTKSFVEPIKILRTSNNFLLVYYNSSTVTECKLIKYSPNGSLDNSFGNLGEVIIFSRIGTANINSSNEIYAIVPGSLVKYTNIGNIDTSFGTNGSVSLLSIVGNISNNISISAIDFDNDNKIVLFGLWYNMSYNYDFIGRLNVDGTKDNSFSENGTSSYYINPTFFAVWNSFVDQGKIINNVEFVIVHNLRGSATWRLYKTMKYISSSSSLSVNENNNKPKDLYFNNPFNNELTFNLKEKIKNVEIYDESGKLILNEKTSKLNTFSLAKGIYFIKITTESNKIIYRKGIKN